MGRGAEGNKGTAATAASRSGLEGLIIGNKTRADFHDSKENSAGQVTALRADISVDGQTDPLAVSDWFDVRKPGDEDSYDDALYEAVGNAEFKVVERLVKEDGVDEFDAEELVDLHIIRSDMPAS